MSATLAAGAAAEVAASNLLMDGAHHARRRAAVRHHIPQARARRDPRLHRRRGDHRSSGAWPDRRGRFHHGRVGNRHRAAAVPRRARAEPEPAVAAAEGHFRPRPDAGARVRIRTCRAHPFRAGLQPGSEHRHRPAACTVVDGAGAADASRNRPAQPSARGARLLRPALPGPVDRPDDHHHRGHVARPCGPDRAVGRNACALYGRSDRRAGPRRPLHPQSLVPAGRPPRRARAVRRRGPVRGDRQRGADAHAASFDRAGRLHRWRDARRIALPARAGKRRRAVPLDPARPVLPLGRDADRLQRGRRPARPRVGTRDRDYRREGRPHRRARLPVRDDDGPRDLARPAAQPGWRIRLRPVRPGRERAAHHARSSVAVRRDRDPDDGLDALPDAGDRVDPDAACPSRRSISTGPNSRPRRT